MERKVAHTMQSIRNIKRTPRRRRERKGAHTFFLVSLGMTRLSASIENAELLLVTFFDFVVLLSFARPLLRCYSLCLPYESKQLTCFEITSKCCLECHLGFDSIAIRENIRIQLLLMTFIDSNSDREDKNDDMLVHKWRTVLSISVWFQTRVCAWYR